MAGGENFLLKKAEPFLRNQESFEHRARFLIN